ncbi:MAG TPA: NUMOD1 domain-containing DNA-binding protein [Chitinophagaceae bacterium]|jgi:hypothetical protein
MQIILWYIVRISIKAIAVKISPYQNLNLKSIKGEKWKDIPGLEMYAQVSNYGRIKRLAYELEYSDGRIFLKPEKILKPVIAKIPNRFTNDNIFFLRSAVTLFKQKYNFSIARLVYHCFKKPIDLSDESIVILTKDHNGLNVKPSNLIEASLSQKQKRIFELNRREPLVVDEKPRQKSIENARLTNNKLVTQYDLNGRRIKTFPSIAAASYETGISHSHISNRARGIEYSAGGFIWKQGKARKIDLTPMLEKIAQRKKKNKESFGKKVSQYNMKGKRIAVFDTINDATKNTGIKNTEISKVIRKSRNSAGGFFWMEGHGALRVDLSGHDYGEVLSAKRRQRPIMQYSVDGKSVQRFDSIKAAAHAVGVNSTSIIGALIGKQETSGGFKWKYL